MYALTAARSVTSPAAILSNGVGHQKTHWVDTPTFPRFVGPNKRFEAPSKFQRHTQSFGECLQADALPKTPSSKRKMCALPGTLKSDAWPDYLLSSAPLWKKILGEQGCAFGQPDAVWRLQYCTHCGLHCYSALNRPMISSCQCRFLRWRYILHIPASKRRREGKPHDGRLRHPEYRGNFASAPSAPSAALNFKQLARTVGRTVGPFATSLPSADRAAPSHGALTSPQREWSAANPPPPAYCRRSGS